MDAVLDSATELFALRGPRAVTVRQIAARAGVNHALVHRYYGTKEALLEAVLRNHSERFAELVRAHDDVQSSIPDLFRELQRQGAYVYTLARASMDGMHPEQLQQEFPTLRTMLAKSPRGEPAGDSAEGAAAGDLARDPRVVLAAMSALALGWRIFEEYLVRAAQLDVEPRDAVRAGVEQLIERLVGRRDGGSDAR